VSTNSVAHAAHDIRAGASLHDVAIAITAKEASTLGSRRRGFLLASLLAPLTAAQLTAPTTAEAVTLRNPTPEETAAFNEAMDALVNQGARPNPERFVCSTDIRPVSVSCGVLASATVSRCSVHNKREHLWTLACRMRLISHLAASALTRDTRQQAKDFSFVGCTFQM
jgi:hypothetical protein